MKPSRSSSGQPRAATSPLAPQITSKPSKLRATNDEAPFELPQGAQERYGSPKVEVDAPRGANLNRSGSQRIDLPSLPQTPAAKNVHPPPPPKDLPISGRSSAPLAPGVTKTSLSRRTHDTAPQALPERYLPGVSASPNESRITVPPIIKGSHEALNRQLIPNDLFSPPVRHPAATEPSPQCQL